MQTPKNLNNKELMRLLILKWLCNHNKWAAKHMYALSRLFGKEFTTKELPYKSSRSYELIKDWERKGLISITDYTSKTKKYAYNTTLFAKAIEQEKMDDETRQIMTGLLDDLITVE